MSKTGRYAVRDGKVVKVSDETPKLKPFAFFREDNVNGMFIENLGHNGVWVKSADHKREVLAKLGKREAG